MPDEDEISAYAKSLTVIADGTRLRILFELLQGPAHAKRLAFISGKNRKSIFYHLKVLERAGVIRTIRADTQIEFCIVGSWIDLKGEQRRGFQIQIGESAIVLLPGRLDA